MATLHFSRGVNNYVTPALVGELADTLRSLDEDAQIRSVVLASAGKHFCAGADFGGEPQPGGMIDPQALYQQAMRLFETRKPIIAALHGAVIGAGAGLALVADFRVASTDCRISFNFNRIGIHPGFGLTHTLPRLIGVQHASLLFFTGRRLSADQALAMGVVDDLVEPENCLGQAQRLAAEIATSSPLAVQETRDSLRLGLLEQVRTMNERELRLQHGHFKTLDFAEGVRAMAERRPPAFQGR